PTHYKSFTLDGGGYYSYTPEAGYVGDDTFTYRASSIEGGDPSDPVLVTITMTNSPPDAQDIATTAPMGGVYASSVENGISDPENDPITIVSSTDPELGTLIMYT
ncbi:MAG: Ig-like domain-containing protein, partial [Planctomycetota bacterium]